MDTKLKNRHKLFIVLLVGFLAVLAGLLTGNVYGTAEMAQNAAILCMIAAAAAAWIFPMVRSFCTGDEKIFHIPFETAVFLFILDLVLILKGNLFWLLYYGYMGWISGLYALIGFAVIYWVSGSLRQMYAMGVSEYMRKRSLLVRYGKEASEAAARWMDQLCRSIEKIDLKEAGSRKILGMVLYNFMVLTVICALGYYGIVLLVLYSAVLFYFLRRAYQDLQRRYFLLLQDMNQMAEGNLNVEFAEDLGVFEPLKGKMKTVQEGYQKAVEKEVRSQKMKTELIANVSHDLKTPLTAIITYVSLLKDEKDGKKKEEYIEILEHKSFRLKALIEDLFEVSKANSKNVTLHIVDVDVVNLFKQVKLELEDQFADSGLEFRCDYPEEKILCSLDSQKTYRIFENLLVNVAKYALKGTRVYVRILREDGEAVVRIMNISAQELTVKPEDLTERFVRGDAARNTEGSGLGLAIAKSFAELQGGKFLLDIEGDLFKAEVRFTARKAE